MAKAKKQESTESKTTSEGAESSKKVKAASDSKKMPVVSKAVPAASASSAKAPAAKKGAATVVGGSTAKSAPIKSAAPALAIQASFAAETAAKVIGQRAGERPTLTESTATVTPRPESSTFRNLKEGLSKPGLAGLNGILGAQQNQKKTNAPFGGGNQVGRGQTFGAASKLNVPRRTGG